MSPFGVAAWAWRGVMSLVVRPVIWSPFLLVAAVQALVLGVLLFFYHPLILPFALPIVRLLGGEGATHYPSLYIALPGMFDRANLVVDTLVSSIAAGAGTLFFARAFGMEKERGVWLRALRSAPTLILLTLLTLGLLFAIDGLGSLAPGDPAHRGMLASWALRGTMILLFVLVQSFLAYSTAWVVLMGHGPWPAIRDSVRVTFRTFYPTAIVVGLPTLILLPLSFASSKADLIAGKFRPEMVAGLISMQVVLQLLSTFLLVGGVTRLFLWRVEAAR